MLTWFGGRGGFISHPFPSSHLVCINGNASVKCWIVVFSCSKWNSKQTAKHKTVFSEMATYSIALMWHLGVVQWNKCVSCVFPAKGDGG